MTLRARVIDPVPSLSRRLSPYVAVLGVGVLGCGVGSATLILVSIALLQLAGLASGRARAHDAEIRTGPGYVEIVRGKRRRKITAKQIAGASTARLGRKLSLALSLERRTEIPLLLALDSERDAARVREALGVGHHGYGRVSYPLSSGQMAKGALLTRLASALFWALVAFTPVAGMLPVVLFGGCLAMLFTVIWVGIALSGPAFGDAIAMAPDAVHTNAPGLERIAYGAIKEMREDERGVALAIDGMSPPWAHLRAPQPRRSTMALDREQRAHLVAQIMAASQRARGAGPVKEEVAQRLGALRRSGASAKEWLARLDMTARMLAGEHGYRTAPIAREDLWAVLEDPEADRDLRAAAARVLLGLDPSAGVRVDAALAAVREPSTAKRIRIAMEPLDDACRELEELDQAERPLLNVLPTPGASTPGRGFHRVPPR